MPTLEERFWAHVQKCRHGETCQRCCWEWQGARMKTGYGTFYVNAQERVRPAPCLALELTNGAMLLRPGTMQPRWDGLYFAMTQWGRVFLATHRCDNPPCCNPHHLRWGTPGDNFRKHTPWLKPGALPSPMRAGGINQDGLHRGRGCPIFGVPGRSAHPAACVSLN